MTRAYGKRRSFMQGGTGTGYVYIKTTKVRPVREERGWVARAASGRDGCSRMDAGRWRGLRSSRGPRRSLAEPFKRTYEVIGDEKKQKDRREDEKRGGFPDWGCD